MAWEPNAKEKRIKPDKFAQFRYVGNFHYREHESIDCDLIRLHNRITGEEISVYSILDKSERLSMQRNIDNHVKLYRQLDREQKHAGCNFAVDSTSAIRYHFCNIISV